MPEISVRNVPVKKVGGQISFPIIKIHLFEIEVEIKNLGVILYRRQLIYFLWSDVWKNKFFLAMIKSASATVDSSLMDKHT